VSHLSLVTPLTRERIAREFDDRGPEACMAEIVEDLRLNNPELLDMASKCARDLGYSQKIMLGFGMFYRLMLAPAVPAAERSMLSPLPRVTPETRDMIVRQIDIKGTEAFTLEIIEDLRGNNPELLTMAHDFAERQVDYLRVMQGLALFYKSLVDQSAADRTFLH
jgi:hypothetical protein